MDTSWSDFCFQYFRTVGLFAGPVGSSRSSDVMTTPNSGLRMGLSRNNKPKPLHQTPKLS
jgi:hypothetical protein